jgi:hypothetical protein
MVVPQQSCVRVLAEQGEPKGTDEIQQRRPPCWLRQEVINRKGIAQPAVQNKIKAEEHSLLRKWFGRTRIRSKVHTLLALDANPGRGQQDSTTRSDRGPPSRSAGSVGRSTPNNGRFRPGLVDSSRYCTAGPRDRTAVSHCRLQLVPREHDAVSRAQPQAPPGRPQPPLPLNGVHLVGVDQPPCVVACRQCNICSSLSASKATRILDRRVLVSTRRSAC